MTTENNNTQTPSENLSNGAGVNIKELIGELEATKMQYKQLEEKYTELSEKAGNLPQLEENLNKYKGFAMEHFKNVLDNSSEYVKEYVNEKQFESDPLQGIQTIKQISEFANKILESAKEKTDPTRSGAGSQGGNKSVDPNDIGSVLNFLESLKKG